MKVKRFVKEYASYKSKRIAENSLMQEKFKEEKLQDIKNYMRVLERGLITVDECIHQINKI